MKQRNPMKEKKIEKITHLFDSDVTQGVYVSVDEAESSVISKLIERKLDRDIAISEQEIENGHYREVTQESNKLFMQELSKTLLSNSDH